MGKDRSGKRYKREQEEQRLAQIAANEDFVRRARIFRLALRDLCIEHGMRLDADSGATANVMCFPTIDILPLAKGQIPELIDRSLDEKEPVEPYVEGDENED